ncbi:NTP transferase domain-containing protein [Candidatus Zixiibacteriota bacterium]
MSESIPVIVLAAGGSTRTKSPKQLFRFEEETLLRRAVGTALDSRCAPVHVVLGSDAERFAPELTGLPVHVTVNREWEEGIGSSIRSGLRAATVRNAEMTAAVFMTVDQPFVTPGILDRLVGVFLDRRPPIVACAYDDTVGTPALFDLALFESLRSLEGDTGAKLIILQQGDAVVTIDAPEVGIDIDTEEDLRRLQQSNQ